MTIGSVCLTRCSLHAAVTKSPARSSRTDAPGTQTVRGEDTNSMTVNAADRLTAYRSDHRIFLVDEEHPDLGHIFRCGTDGIRVHPTRNGRWYHDPGELKTLLDANYGGPWGSPREGLDELPRWTAEDEANLRRRVERLA